MIEQPKPVFKPKKVGVNTIVKAGETVKTYYGEFKNWHSYPVILRVEEKK